MGPQLTQSTPAAKLSPMDARNNLFQSATPLTDQQKNYFCKKITELLDAMTRSLLWPAVQAAHEAENISAEEFANNLFDGTIPRNPPLHQRNTAWKDTESPYRQLDLKVWVRYLSAGKDRVLPDGSFAADQDAFFRHFGIALSPSNDPSQNSSKPVQLVPDWKVLQPLKTAENAGNYLRHENLDEITLPSMADYLYSLLNILKAMRNSDWKEDLSFWREMLTAGFYNAFGKISYSVADIIAYHNACCKPTIPTGQQPQVEKLFSDAGLVVQNGKVTFHGNIIDLSGKNLQNAWAKIGNESRDAGVRSLRASLLAARRPLPEPLSYSQKEQTVAVLKGYTQKLKEQLCVAIETAHAWKGIDPQDFLTGLTVPTGSNSSILKRNYIPSSPYAQELQTWLKYLCYGGLRRLPTGGTAKDQDAFFEYFNISRPTVKLGRTEPEGEIVSHLRQLINVRNYITAHVSDVTIERQTLQSLTKWYNALLALFVPMSQKSWLLQKDCAELVAALSKDFYGASQPRYSPEDILECADIPPEQHREALQLLNQMGLPVRDGGVIVPQDITRLIAGLKAALPLQKALADPNSWVSGSLGAISLDADIAIAVSWFEEAASAQPPIAAAQYFLGCCYLGGYGKNRNADQGIILLRSADRLGYAPAQTALGRCYMHGLDGQFPDPRKAAEQYQKAAHQGDINALYLLGCCYQTGSGVPKKDTAEAIRLFRDAESHGHKHAAFSLAKMLCTDTPAGDPMKKKGLGTLQALAEQHFGPALQLLADWYRTGSFELVSQDIPKARELALQAAEQGFSDAAFDLACDYSEGTNTAPLREEDAFFLFYKAATAGHSQAKLRLAQCFENGIGIFPDFEQAFSWYEAYSQDHPDDMAVHKRLAQCYEDGVGVEKNKGLAMYRYQCAADLGDPEAQFVLGKLLDRYWIQQAAENKYPEAVSYLSHGQANDKFLPYYLSCAEAGDAWAQLQLGLYYAFKKPEDAFFWFEKAALQEYPDAMYQLGRCYEYGKGTDKDMRQAMHWYTQSAHFGEGKAFFRLMNRYLAGGDPAEDDSTVSTDGLPLEPDKAKALEFCRKAASLGGTPISFDATTLDMDVSEEETYFVSLWEKRDYYALGKLYAKHNAWDKAFPEYMESAQSGKRDAMFVVAYCYECGLGVQQDAQKAARWYAKLLADGGDPEKIADLLYKNARHIWKNLPAKALEPENLYHDRGICAYSSDAPAAPSVRVAADGSIVPQKAEAAVFTKPLWDAAVDKKLTGAFRMIQRAARLGLPKAMYLVGYCYQHGYGPFINQRAADSWYLKAAEHGCATACTTIGSYYLHGHGYAFSGQRIPTELPFEKDIQTAIEWYRKAAAQGDDIAIRSLQELNAAP